VSLWDNEESERQQRTQRILIIVGAVAATLVVFWVFRNAISLASQPSNGVGFASSGRARQLINGMDSEGGARPPQIAAAPNPGTPFSAPPPAAPSYVPPPPPPLVGGAYAPRPFVAPTLPELSPEERAKAKSATAPLRSTLAAVHDFDRNSFWNNEQSSTEEADAAVDALGAMVSLYGHPERFPVPMRGTVATAATGIRSYLRLTLDAAATNDPQERQRLRPTAAQRLAEADAAVIQLEGANPKNGGFAAGTAAN
jgi:hypothetical protein